MRKKMTMAAVAAMMAVSAYVGANSLTPSEQLSGLMLENIEALADIELVKGQEYTCYDDIHNKDASQVLYCPECRYVPGTDIWYSISSTCTAK